MIPTVKSVLPANEHFMETAGIEPARHFPRHASAKSLRMQGKDGAAPFARSAPDTEGEASMQLDPIPVPLRDRTGTIIAFAVIDAANAYLNEFRWYLDSDTRGGGKYARRAVRVNGKFKACYLHRAVFGADPCKGYVIDHINGLPLDNRRANLRLATIAENAQNQRSSHAGAKSSRYRGVTWDKARQRWMARGTLNGIPKTIGRFDSEAEAAEAAAVWRREHMPFSSEAMVA